MTVWNGERRVSKGTILTAEEQKIHTGPCGKLNSNRWCDSSCLHSNTGQQTLSERIYMICIEALLPLLQTHIYRDVFIHLQCKDTVKCVFFFHLEMAQTLILWHQRDIFCLFPFFISSFPQESNFLGATWCLSFHVCTHVVGKPSIYNGKWIKRKSGQENEKYFFYYVFSRFDLM